MKYWSQTEYHISDEAAFEIFDTWAKGAEGEEHGTENAAKWASFEPSETNPRTLGSLFADAKFCGFTGKSDAVVTEDGSIVDYRDIGIEGEVRKFIADRMLKWGFDEGNDPVKWTNVIKAAPYCFIDAKGAKSFFRDDGSQSPVTKDLMIEQMTQEFGEFCDPLALGRHVSSFEGVEGDETFNTDAKIKAFYKDVPNTISTAFWSVVARNKVIQSLQMQVDMFGDEMVPTMSRNVATISLPFRGFVGGDVEDQKCVDDYLEHNPRFHDILDFLLYSRFASVRKTSYLWLHASSDWGKGFLFDRSGVIGGLGLCQQMGVKEIEAAMEGKPVGVDKFSMVDQWVLHVDEFKGVKAELKLLDSSISASPKNMLRFTAPLYAKVFTSAESVASLVGEAGVEEQFARRFSYMRCTGALSERSVFNSAGMWTYTGACREYARRYLMDGVERLVSLGVGEASRVSEVWLRSWHEANGLGVAFGSLDESVDALALEIAAVISRFCAGVLADNGIDPRAMIRGSERIEGAPARFVEKLCDAVGVMYDVDGEKFCVVSRVGSLCSAWVNEVYDRSEAGKMGFKKSVIAGGVMDILAPDRSSEMVNGFDENRLAATKRGVRVAKQN